MAPSPLQDFVIAPGAGVQLMEAEAGLMPALGHILLDLGFQVHLQPGAGDETPIQPLLQRGAMLPDPGQPRDGIVAHIHPGEPAWRAECEQSAGEPAPFPATLGSDAFVAALIAPLKCITVESGTAGRAAGPLLAYLLDQVGGGLGYLLSHAPLQLGRPGRWLGVAGWHALGDGAPPPGWFVREVPPSAAATGLELVVLKAPGITLQPVPDHAHAGPAADCVCVFDMEGRGRVTVRPRVDASGVVRGGFVLERAGRPPLEFSVREDAGVTGGVAGAVLALVVELGFDPGTSAGALGRFAGAEGVCQALTGAHPIRVIRERVRSTVELSDCVTAAAAPGGRRVWRVSEREAPDGQLRLEPFGSPDAAAGSGWGTLGTHIVGGRTLAAETESAATQLLGELQPGDVLVCAGAGRAVARVAHRVAALVSGRFEEALTAELRAAVDAATVIRRREPLAKRTTLRVGGSADWLIEPASEQDLAVVLRWARRHGLPFHVLGRGSNLLVRDEGVRGVVISLAHPAFSRIEIEGTEIRAGAGARLKAVSVEARRRGVAGFEFFEGIPGSIGGALRMNAGAMGAATFDRVARVRVMDREGQVHEFAPDEIEVKYRSCPLLRQQIAVGVVLRGTGDVTEAIASRMEAYSSKRWESQPKEPSAGCMFKNLPSIPAGRLVDELGLKGLCRGGARVSGVHGNFIVNEGMARALDVLELVAMIRLRAWHERGLTMETEVEVWGDPGLVEEQPQPGRDRIDNQNGSIMVPP